MKYIVGHKFLVKDNTIKPSVVLTSFNRGKQTVPKMRDEFIVGVIYTIYHIKIQSDKSILYMFKTNNTIHTRVFSSIKEAENYIESIS